MELYEQSKLKSVLKILLVCALIFILGNSSLLIFKETENINLNKKMDIKTIEKNQNEIYISDLFNPISNFTGDLTGYGADCALCSGILACHPRTNVFTNGIYFEDTVYGKVRIVATSKNYPCGTILKFSVPKLSEEPIIAVTMDRGVTGNTVDLLSESEAVAATNVGRVKNQTFEILRLGW